MNEIIEAKIRKIGTSHGVILPRRVIIKENLKEGKIVSLIVLKKILSLLMNLLECSKMLK